MAIKSFLALASDSVELPYWQELVQWDDPLYPGGYLVPPNKPGLGIKLNEKACRKHLAAGSGFFE
jgi:L-alanine-DL-glutamate epimerase-like enolase superfamily enzyme